MRAFNDFTELAGCVGQSVGHSDWLTISQAQIQLFADATGDQQWIHTDIERAAAGPFGAPVAHGFLTLSLLPAMFATAFSINNVKLGVNYGLNKVRFTRPVPVNSKLRGNFVLQSIDMLPAAVGTSAGAQLTWLVTMEVEGGDKPVCIAESITRQYI